MKNRDACLGLAGVFTLFLIGCGGGDGADGIIGTGFNISGAVEKGPFVIGSTVTINVLNGAGDSTAETLVEQTKDNLGHFSFSYNQRKAVRITAQGYHFNEISGKLSNSVLTLRGIYEISDSAQQTAYVNILTHLTSERVVKHIKNGLTTSDAINTAQTEFLDAFRTVINVGELPPFSRLSIYDVNTDARTGNAYLLALSSIIYQYATNRSQSNVSSVDSELTLALNKLASDFADDGRFAQLDLIGNLVTASRLVRPDVITQNLILRSSEVLGTSLDAANLNLFLDTDGDGVNNTLDTDDDNDDVLDLEDISPYTYAPNNAPIAASTQITLDEDTSANLSLAIQSKKPDTLSFYLVKAPLNGVIEGVFPNLRYRPKPNFNGSDRIEYKASNGVEDSNIAYIDIAVNPVNDAPEISGNPPTSLKVGSTYEFKPLAADADGDQLAFEVKNLPTWASLNTATGRIFGTPTNHDAGLFENLEVSVTDGKSVAAIDPFNVIISPNPWTFRRPMPATHWGGASVVYNGKIFIFGGSWANPNHDAGQINSAEVKAYDPTTDTWENRSPMPSGSSMLKAHAIDGKIFVFIEGFGSNEVFAYDPENDAWTIKSNLPAYRRDTSSMAVGKKVYIIGGSGMKDDGPYRYDGGYAFKRNVEIYDTENNTWSAGTPLPLPVGLAASCVTANKLYIVGGENESNYLKEVFIYDTLTNIWTPSISMPTTRFGGQCALLDNSLVVMGGFEDHPSPNLSSSVYAFSLERSEWKALTPINNARAYFSAEVVANNRLFVLDGSYPDLNSIEEYDPLLEP